MTWVDNVDKSVAALVSQIEKLKVKANDQIPSVMKLNKITFPSVANKQASYLFKIGSSYYERDPQTLEEVDKRLEVIRTQAALDKELIEKETLSNAEAIANNKKVVEKITQIMTDLGIPSKWSRSYFKTASSRKQTVETNSAGYLGDLQRNVPTSDDSGTKLQRLKDTVSAAERYAETLKQKIRQEQAEKDKEEKRKKEIQALARLQVKYGLSEHSYWDDVLETLDSKDKYFMLARAMNAVRNDWNDGFGPVEYALAKFVVGNPEDEEIEKCLQGILESEEDDGRIFRDCEYNYSALYAKAPDELLADYETLKEYYGAD